MDELLNTLAYLRPKRFNNISLRFKLFFFVSDAGKETAAAPTGQVEML